VVAIWSLIIFYFAVSQTQKTSDIKEMVAADLIDDSISGDTVDAGGAVVR
jgi:hypothetical protein